VSYAGDALTLTAADVRALRVAGWPFAAFCHRAMIMEGACSSLLLPTVDDGRLSASESVLNW